MPAPILRRLPDAALSGACACLLLALGAGCAATGPSAAAWPPRAKQWFDRAESSYRNVDMDDAELAIDNALRLAGDREDVRVLAARIALAQLDHDRAIELLQGLTTAEARAIRGRAFWYSYRMDQSADELEKLLADPDVRDPWATETVKLARRGAGREPFKLSGGLLAVTEMPQVASTALVVPVEVNGEPALALIATNVPEAVVDSSAGAEPSWVSLRFGEQVEVADVPALAQDLSGVSRQLNAPIKMLLGVNLLRHLHPTIDFTGRQFVVRTFDPPPPPRATTVKVGYVRGGGMVMRSALGTDEASPWASLLIDTSMTFPLALDAGGWKKAGVDPSQLVPVPSGGSLRHGVVPLLRLGAFEVPQVPGVSASATRELEQALGIELDGFVGSGLLAAFRVTLVDRGRTMWLEDMPEGMLSDPGGRSGEGAGEDSGGDAPEDEESGSDDDGDNGDAPPEPLSKPATPARSGNRK